jgi:hypothetical protein
MLFRHAQHARPESWHDEQSGDAGHESELFSRGAGGNAVRAPPGVPEVAPAITATLRGGGACRRVAYRVALTTGG